MKVLKFVKRTYLANRIHLVCEAFKSAVLLILQLICLLLRYITLISLCDRLQATILSDKGQRCVCFLFRSIFL